MKLEWQSASPSLMTWYQAMTYADSLGENWRLPTRSELLYAFDAELLNRKENENSWKPEDYWSASTFDCQEDQAWQVRFYLGTWSPIERESKSSLNMVKLCRGEA